MRWHAPRLSGIEGDEASRFLQAQTTFGGEGYDRQWFAKEVLSNLKVTAGNREDCLRPLGEAWYVESKCMTYGSIQRMENVRGTGTSYRWDTVCHSGSDGSRKRQSTVRQNVWRRQEPSATEDSEPPGHSDTRVGKRVSIMIRAGLRASVAIEKVVDQLLATLHPYPLEAPLLHRPLCYPGVNGELSQRTI